MRLSRLLLASLALGLAALSPVRAQVPAAPASPYTVVVPVEDTSEAQRDAAFADALGQVLVRVAGGQDLRGKAGYADALKGAPGMVQQYQYQRAGAGLAVQATFDQGAVRRLIQKLGVPAAGEKPPLLAVVHGSDGSLLGKDSLDALAQAAAARGLEVIYAAPDQAPDLQALASADPAALAAVARQYHTGLILLGDLKGGRSEWTLVSGGRAQHWTGSGTSEDAMLAEAGGAAVDRIGKQLNVIGGAVSDGKLWVTGLQSAMDYANLLATLRAEPAVRQVDLLGAQDGGLMLGVKASMPSAALAASLAAEGRMMQAEAHPGADASLRWLH
ncbi:hypothetical protein ASG87_01235 [Frateuria sp. Soil773]|uniref:DUF2066 domain-containing protein n=1 Tax=Frateuria sp. Soil773 TaxID=1736407 RepID=UPI0006FECDD5|nr:DUF2066 domain-containing protein [Frateuria sp. Soil773]KRE90787.1 hypothetical protein ASG87_01235 [Frateuria sp. Soil773]